MKFIVERASTSGYKYHYDEEDMLTEHPPIKGAVRDCNLQYDYSNTGYNPWVIEVKDMCELLQIIENENQDIIIQTKKEAIDDYNTELYTIVIYDSYRE